MWIKTQLICLVSAVHELLHGSSSSSFTAMTLIYIMLSCNYQLRVHCAEALGTPIVGDYKYGWYVHRRWQQIPSSDREPMSGEPYRLRRPEGLAVQKGSVLSKVPLLHLHCREMVIPNVAKFITKLEHKCHDKHCPAPPMKKSDLLRFVAPMPPHMQIGWNVMSSFLVWFVHEQILLQMCCLSLQRAVHCASVFLWDPSFMEGCPINIHARWSEVC